MIYQINTQNIYEEIKNKFNSLQPSDILNIESGIYKFNQSLNIHINGIINKNIIIKGNKNVIFDFSSQSYGESGLILYGEYLHLKNITIRYAGYKGIHSYLKNSVFENIEVYGSCDSGIQMYGGGNTLIKCISHDNFGYKTMHYNNIVKFGFNSDGFSDKLYEDVPNTYIECESYNNSDDGFDFYKRVSNTPTKLIKCKSHHNGKRYFNMCNYPRYEIDKDWFDQFKNKNNVYTIYGNHEIASLKKYPSYGNGNGFKLGGKECYHCIELHDCEAYNNKFKGFDQNHNSGDIFLFNCIAKNNSLDFGFDDIFHGNAYFENCKSKNNKVKIKCKTHESVNCSWN